MQYSISLHRGGTPSLSDIHNNYELFKDRTIHYIPGGRSVVLKHFGFQIDIPIVAVQC